MAQLIVHGRGGSRLGAAAKVLLATTDTDCTYGARFSCSYEQVVLNPIADAIKGAMRPDTKASSASYWLSPCA